MKRRLASPEKSDTGRCEHCGKTEPKNRLKKKPYCSTQCAKAAAKATPATTNGSTTPVNEINGDDKNGKAESLTVEPPAASPTSTTATVAATPSTPSSTSATTTTPTGSKRPNSQTNGLGSPEAKKQAVETSNGSVTAATPAVEEESFLVKWTVDEVCDYIRNHSGYGDYAEEFMMHEIDGQALLLLNENHLVQTMNIKLGPALKIMSKIEAIKNNGPPTEN